MPVLLCAAAHAAGGCDPKDLDGPYGFLLSGTTTISGSPAAIASVGRLVFAAEGKLSGYSSVNFKGFFLGNPVTGSYEFHRDCTLTWSLQDDSGGLQQFAGTVTPGSGRVAFHQTDPGAGGRGVMARTFDTCKDVPWRGRFDFALAGASTPFAPDGARKSVSEKGVVEADGDGNLSLTQENSKWDGSYELQPDCFVMLYFETETPIQLRGILVNGGKEVLAIQTDPAQTGTARLTARQP
ncbi:MAG: hypothetical protein LAP87_11785 [Acidobacteriia bacterium]|nr:hypothetical protein [Terriglobia bacterium]